MGQRDQLKRSGVWRNQAPTRVLTPVSQNFQLGSAKPMAAKPLIFNTQAASKCWFFEGYGMPVNRKFGLMQLGENLNPPFRIS
jgi:hypothetical protein